MKTTKAKTNNKETTLVSVWLPKELAARLAQNAKRQDLTKSQLLRKAIKTVVNDPS